MSTRADGSAHARLRAVRALTDLGFRAEADLGSGPIVVGRRRQPWLLDRLERSLGHQLLGRVRGDLLHVPLTREHA